MHEAQHYEMREPRVLCRLCPQFCRLRAGETGLCGVRREHQGKLYTLNYGYAAATAVDPIEKKPLYHFYPGRMIFSAGTAGCNLDCGFCQNWQLVKHTRTEAARHFSPQDLLQLALSQTTDPLGIAYTYAEPGMWFEFVKDTAILVKERGLKNVLVTNGYLNPEPLRELLPLMDAFNIDVKAFSDEYYRNHCAGRLEPVLRYVEIAAQSAHAELTYLIVPGLNDREDEMERFTSWVAAINPAIPVHLTRYYPQHRFTLPPTAVSRMEALHQVARQQLLYVYLGNVPGHDRANTACPDCGRLLIERMGYGVVSHVYNSACPACRRPVDMQGI